MNGVCTKTDSGCAELTLCESGPDERSLITDTYMQVNSHCKVCRQFRKSFYKHIHSRSIIRNCEILLIIPSRVQPGKYLLWYAGRLQANNYNNHAYFILLCFCSGRSVSMLKAHAINVLWLDYYHNTLITLRGQLQFLTLCLC